MEVIDPGHYYNLHVLDKSVYDTPIFGTELCFVKREGEGYPGNVGHHAGTTTQEVLRALIDRTEYVHNQVPHPANLVVLNCLRLSIYNLEKRAADRHGREFPYKVYDGNGVGIEKLPFCKTCGHIGCTDHG